MILGFYIKGSEAFVFRESCGYSNVCFLLYSFSLSKNFKHFYKEMSLILDDDEEKS